MKCEICGKEIEKSSYHNAIVCSSECYHEHFWLEIAKEIKEDPKARVVVDGSCYYSKREMPIDNNKYTFHGFDGRIFKIRYNEGETVTTKNLWHNGEIPDNWKDKIPNNAIFE